LTQLKPDFSTHNTNDFNNFTHTAYDLYQYLLSGIELEIENKRLLIIPDGFLGYLPFEVLITNDTTNHEIIDYGALPYLSSFYPLSYAYSATLRFGKVRKNYRGNKRILAVVPDYKEFKPVKEPSGDVLTLPDLPFALEEAENSVSIVGGTILKGVDADKEKFMAQSENYSVLHLAMHTIIDDENPMYSRLVFQQVGDSLDFYSLGTYELFSLKLNADLAVLSACNTGAGKLMQGEGVMSLTRGFVYAGVNSIVMTNWEVHDQSGSYLMERFYHYLDNGDKKDVALQLARLDFLSSANKLKSHPYFWASYVLIGDSNAINLHKNVRMVTGLVYGFLLLLILFQFFSVAIKAKG